MQDKKAWIVPTGDNMSIDRKQVAAGIDNRQFGMGDRSLRATRSMTVCHWDAHKIMRFFRVPTGAAVTVVAESSASGCVEILYEHQPYVGFKRDLMSHLQTRVSESA
jgi:hypothetical protein